MKNEIRKRIGHISKEVLVQFMFFFTAMREFYFFGFRGVTCPSNWLKITGACQWINGDTEMLFLLLAVLLMSLIISWEHGWNRFLHICRRNWMVLCFVGFAGTSMIWSIGVTITLYKFSLLLGCTLIALYLGDSYSLEGLTRRIAWFYVVICLISIYYALFLPEGIMGDAFYNELWNGMFTHKNFMGCFMALGVGLFLVKLFGVGKTRKRTFLFNLIMFAITSFLLFMSKSTTGIITALVIVFMTFAVFIWSKWKCKLKPLHYFGGISFVLILLAISILNLDFFLKLFGKDATLTGRVTIWRYLFDNVIHERFWIGHGYGAIWHLEGFIIKLTSILQWETPIVLGDNGYVDILLHLGFLGVFFLFSLIVIGFIRATGYFIKEKTVLSVLPVLVLVYAVIANISLSLILESEILVWFIVLTLLVSTQRDAQTTSHVIDGTKVVEVSRG